MDDPVASVLVGTAAAVGGLLMGVGTLPLSHPVADPWVVQGQTVAGGGLLSVVGLVPFVASLFPPRRAIRGQLPTAEAVGLSVDSRSADTYWSDATSVAFTVITPDFRAY